MSSSDQPAYVRRALSECEAAGRTLAVCSPEAMRKVARELARPPAHETHGPPFGLSCPCDECAVRDAIVAMLRAMATAMAKQRKDEEAH